MNLSYFYCTSCGYEDMDIFAAFIHQTASGSVCGCPECGSEVLVDEEE